MKIVLKSILGILILVVLSSCRDTELEQRYESLRAQYLSLERQKSQEISQLRNELSDARNKVSNEQTNSSIAEQKNRLLLEDLAIYDNILNLVRNDQIIEAVALSATLKTAERDSLSVAIGEYLRTLNDIVLLDKAEEQLAIVTGKNLTSGFAATAKLISLVMIGVMAIITVFLTCAMIIRQTYQIRDVTLRAAAISMNSLLLFLFLFLSSENPIPISLFIASAVGGIDLSEMAQSKNFLASIIVWAIPFCMGLIVSGYFREILVRKSSDRELLAGSIAMTFAFIFAVDTTTQFFWLQLPETLRYGNTLFAVGAILSFFVAAVRTSTPSKETQEGI